MRRSGATGGNWLCIRSLEGTTLPTEYTVMRNEALISSNEARSVIVSSHLDACRSYGHAANAIHSHHTRYVILPSYPQRASVHPITRYGLRRPL
jgi:hypothetical protein